LHNNFAERVHVFSILLSSQILICDCT